MSDVKWSDFPFPTKEGLEIKIILLLPSTLSVSSSPALVTWLLSCHPSAVVITLLRLRFQVDLPFKYRDPCCAFSLCCFWTQAELEAERGASFTPADCSAYLRPSVLFQGYTLLISIEDEYTHRLQEGKSCQCTVSAGDMLIMLWVWKCTRLCKQEIIRHDQVNNKSSKCKQKSHTSVQRKLR